MRNPFTSLSKVPKVSEAGRFLHGKLESALDKFPGFVHDVGSALRGDPMPPPLDGPVEVARGAILDLVGGRADEGTTRLQPSIFEAYRRLTGDPDEHLATWLREGCPLRNQQTGPVSRSFPNRTRRTRFVRLCHRPC